MALPISDFDFTQDFDTAFANIPLDIPPSALFPGDIPSFGFGDDDLDHDEASGGGSSGVTGPQQSHLQQQQQQQQHHLHQQQHHEPIPTTSYPPSALTPHDQQIPDGFLNTPSPYPSQHPSLSSPINANSAQDPNANRNDRIQYTQQESSRPGSTTAQFNPIRNPLTIGVPSPSFNNPQPFETNNNQYRQDATFMSTLQPPPPTSAAPAPLFNAQESQLISQFFDRIGQNSDFFFNPKLDHSFIEQFESLNDRDGDVQMGSLHLNSQPHHQNFQNVIGNLNDMDPNHPLGLAINQNHNIMMHNTQQNNSARAPSSIPNPLNGSNLLNGVAHGSNTPSGINGDFNSSHIHATQQTQDHQANPAQQQPLTTTNPLSLNTHNVNGTRTTLVSSYPQQASHSFSGSVPQQLDHTSQIRAHLQSQLQDQNTPISNSLPSQLSSAPGLSKSSTSTITHSLQRDGSNPNGGDASLQFGTDPSFQRGKFNPDLSLSSKIRTHQGTEKTSPPPEIAYGFQIQSSTKSPKDEATNGDVNKEFPTQGPFTSSEELNMALDTLTKLSSQPNRPTSGSYSVNHNIETTYPLLNTNSAAAATNGHVTNMIRSAETNDVRHAMWFNNNNAHIQGNQQHNGNGSVTMAIPSQLVPNSNGNLSLPSQGLAPAFNSQKPNISFSNNSISKDKQNGKLPKSGTSIAGVTIALATETTQASSNPNTSSSSSTTSTKSKASSARSRRENLSEDQKRINHIYSEKRRRDLIKTQFKEMCSLVPKLCNSTTVSGSPAFAQVHPGPSSYHHPSNKSKEDSLAAADSKRATTTRGRGRSATGNTPASSKSKSVVLNVVYEYMIHVMAANKAIRLKLEQNGIDKVHEIPIAERGQIVNPAKNGGLKDEEEDNDDDDDRDENEV